MKNRSTPWAYMLFIFLAGCGGTRDETDYCGAHKNFHAEHQNDVAQLNVRYTDDGMIDSVFEVSYSALRADAEPGAVDAAAGVLEDVNKVFTVANGQACELTVSSVKKHADKLTAHYAFNCGGSNRLEKVDIRLMEYLPAIDEMEADIETSAVRKTFLISRQCGKPIYNYRQLPED